MKRMILISRLPSFLFLPSLPRIIRLPDNKDIPGRHDFIFLEQVIRYYATRFFIGYDLLEARPFRLTRDADLYIDEEDAQDLVVRSRTPAEERQRAKLSESSSKKGRAALCAAS